MTIALVWTAILGVWLATPLMGDRVALALSMLYWVVLVSASLTGLVLAFRFRRTALGIASALTLVAWPIVLGIALLAGGIA